MKHVLFTALMIFGLCTAAASFALPAQAEQAESDGLDKWRAGLRKWDKSLDLKEQELELKGRERELERRESRLDGGEESRECPVAVRQACSKSGDEYKCGKGDSWKSKWQHKRCCRFWTRALVFFAVLNTLLAIAVGMDLRKNSKLSGLWIVIVLIGSIPATVAYALFRLVEQRDQKNA